jgi:hypothetical protein
MKKMLVLLLLMAGCAKDPPHGLIFKLGDNASEDYAAGMKTGLETCGRFESVEAMKNQDGSVTFKATFKKGGEK